jgi:hypothetical protein
MNDRSRLVSVRCCKTVLLGPLPDDDESPSKLFRKLWEFVRFVTIGFFPVLPKNLLEIIFRFNEL